MTPLTKRAPTSIWKRVAVAVGMPVARHPPHKTVRARQPIRLPPRMSGVKALHGMRMENTGSGNPPGKEAFKPIPSHITPLTATH